MKRIFICLVFIFAPLTAQVNTSDNSKYNDVQTSKQISQDSKIFEIRQRGCCSWHGGVSGCSSGRIVCNDGTYSPSCTCYTPINPLG